MRIYFIINYNIILYNYELFYLDYFKIRKNN